MDDQHPPTPLRGDDDSEVPKVFKIASPGRRAAIETLSRGAVAGVAVVATQSCGGGDGGANSPAAPSAVATTTAPATHTLTGTVTAASGMAATEGGAHDATAVAVAGATLTIVDGPNANRAATTDGNGYYSMGNLVQSGFTIRCSAPRYNSTSKPCTLTSSQTINFVLTLIPTTTTARNTTSTGCSCNSQCSCNPMHCSCNPLTYWYPN